LATCYAGLKARDQPKAVLGSSQILSYTPEHMLKKSVIAGTIAIFVSVVAVSLWMQKSSIGVLMMSLFGMT